MNGIEGELLYSSLLCAFNTLCLYNFFSLFRRFPLCQFQFHFFTCVPVTQVPLFYFLLLEQMWLCPCSTFSHFYEIVNTKSSPPGDGAFFLSFFFLFFVYFSFHPIDELYSLFYVVWMCKIKRSKLKQNIFEIKQKDSHSLFNSLLWTKHQNKKQVCFNNYL